jgi:heat-inducible transcriptional repressor
LCVTGLSHRSRKILFAAVTEHIASGRPVGSRTLARRYGLDLSPATIRNALADLEELGFLTQPHTSAGRVPTAKALRTFITALNDFDELSAEQRQAMGERVEEIYAGDRGSRLHQTGRLLSELTGAAAVISAPPTDARKLQQLRFIATKPGQLLAVLVFSDGMVENRYIGVEQKLVDTELTRIHNLLNDVVEGRSLGGVRDLLERRLADDRVELDALRKRAFELAQQALEAVDRGADTLVIEGSARLVELPDYEDVD